MRGDFTTLESFHATDQIKGFSTSLQSFSLYFLFLSQCTALTVSDSPPNNGPHCRAGYPGLRPQTDSFSRPFRDSPKSFLGSVFTARWSVTCECHCPHVSQDHPGLKGTVLFIRSYGTGFTLPQHYVVCGSSFAFSSTGSDPIEYFQSDLLL